MTAKKIFPILIVIVIAGVLIYSFSSGSESAEQYISEIKKERAEKDNFMKKDEGSPFVQDSTIAFSPLHYFEPDVKYRVNASIEPVQNKKMVVLATSDGKEKKYMEYAYARFKLNGVESKLLILEIVDMGPYKGTLFLAFADETSAKETYGAGRYLDLKKVPGAATLLLDFNKAYNPYCAYSEKFSCPFPPSENIVKVAIAAGEKTFH
ncbi:MAG: hypothetical protein C0523_04045 [Cytophaga sp.]|jgi:uncharacterized protein (DUF1684 family)|nr:hypothetical protein [Cytophaga sp.]